MKKKIKLLVMPAAILGASLSSCNPGEPVITYTLDSDIVLKKIDHDIEIVDNPNLPGKSIAHKDRKNTNFNVLVFTDLHLDHYQQVCNYTFSMLARNIMHVDPKPDLIVFCGDNITSSLNEPRTHQFAKLLEDLGVYWCAVLGNHERNAKNPKSIERDKMINIFCQYPHCLIDNTTKKLNSGEIVWGIGNSLVNLISDEGVTQSLYFLDSGTEMTQADMEEYSEEIKWFVEHRKAKADETEFYDYIKDSQVKWYNETFTKVNKEMTKEKKDLPHSTIFTHVPLMEHEVGYLKLFNEHEKEQGVELQDIAPNSKMRVFTDYPQDSTKCPNHYARELNELYKISTGFIKGERMRRREDMCYGPHDVRYINQGKHTPIFEAMKSFGTNNALFCGHDHQNNFALKYDDVILGYIQPACYSSNNLFTKGLLGAHPNNPEGKGKYDGYLMQGYTQISYKNTPDSGDEKNIINSLKQVENYNAWKKERPDLYPRIIELIANEYLRSKHKVYVDNHASYLDGKE